jgi:hypothetical protein
MPDELTIIVPIFNEEECLPAFFSEMDRFIPALVQLQGGKVKQTPVSHSPRYAGTSKYHLFNRLVGPFFDTLAFRWMRSRYIRYKIAD